MRCGSNETHWACQYPNAGHTHNICDCLSSGNSSVTLLFCFSLRLFLLLNTATKWKMECLVLQHIYFLFYSFTSSHFGVCAFVRYLLLWGLCSTISRSRATATEAACTVSTRNEVLFFRLHGEQKNAYTCPICRIELFVNCYPKLCIILRIKFIMQAPIFSQIVNCLNRDIPENNSDVF